MPTIFTIGHSNRSLEAFLDLLKRHGVEVVVDVRSQPYSRYTPHFNGPDLKAALAAQGISYLFMGKELGGRPEGEQYYDGEGRADYAQMASSPLFQEGIARLERGAGQYRLALMCGEEDPKECHRRLLVGRVLDERGFAVHHIRGDGSVQTEAEAAQEEPAGGRNPAQPPLFELPEEEKAWKSTRSVSPRDRRRTSSGR